MARRSNIIGRQVFDLTYPSADKSHELQNRVSSLFNLEIQSGIESLLDRMIPDHRMIRIDSISIDLGIIPMESLEYELTAKVLEKLEAEVRLLLLHDNDAVVDGPTSVEAPVSRSYAELLEYFLLSGMLPWWASADNADTPAAAMEHLLRESAQELRKLLLRAGNAAHARRRMAFQFSVDQIRSVIRVLEPSEAEFIFGYQVRVVTSQRERQVVKAEITEFDRAVWEFILTYLLVDRGSHFNRREFVRSNLAMMAAHFNLDFNSLLSLFAAAITRTDADRRQVDSLQAIILELTTERRIDLPEDRLYVRAEQPGAGDLELIRYYLVFGSFSPGTPRPDLDKIMTTLLRNIPRTTEAMIRHVGQQRGSRLRIVRTFPEEILKTILRVIEPDNAEYITDYVEEIRQNQVKKGLVKTQTDELMQSVWEFVLEYLVVDQGSVFNRQMFVETNIRRLANRYNLSYLELLRFMVTNIAMTQHNSTRHLTLFHDLTTVYKLHTGGSAADAAGDSILFDSREDLKPAKASPRSSMDLMLFWLRSGYMPWWAGAQEPGAVFSELIGMSPADTVLLIRFAGLHQDSRKRLVYQLPFETLIRAFSLMPPGELIAGYTNAISSHLTGSKTANFRNKAIIEQNILFVLWEELSSNSYSQLNTVRLAAKVFVQLASWHQVPAGKFLKALPPLSSHPLADYFSEAYRLALDMEDRRERYNTELLPDWSDTNSIETAISSYHDDPDLITGAIALLQYFIRNNRLPEKFSGLQTAAISDLLRHLVIYVYREKPQQLLSVMDGTDGRADAILKVFDVFSLTRSTLENEIGKALAAHLEKNIALYIRQTTGSDDPAVTVNQLIDSYLSAAHDPGKLEFLKQLLKHSTVSMKLAVTYSDDAVYGLIHKSPLRLGWGGGTVPFLRSMQGWFSDVITDHLDRERLNLLMRTFNLMMFGAGWEFTGATAYINRLLKFLYDTDYQLLLRVSPLLYRSGSQPETIEQAPVRDLSDTIRKELEPWQAAGRHESEVAKDIAASEQRDYREILPDIDEERQHEEELMRLEMERLEEEARKAKALPEIENIYIRNAGMVILHPFLSTYFSRLQMIEKGKFVSEAMRHRAVHLLQYLAYGTVKNEEHELVLNKILCDIPLDEPIPLEIELTEQEQTVSAELIRVVISQWEKMKNSSPENFQASFLQREGALSRIEESWNLKVEQRGYDVILQTLPWSLGMVKTSWMTGFIYVEWT